MWLYVCVLFLACSVVPKWSWEKCRFKILNWGRTMSLTCVHHDHDVALDLFVFGCSVQCLHWSIHVLFIAHSVPANISIPDVSLSVEPGEDDSSLIKPKKNIDSTDTDCINICVSGQLHRESHTNAALFSVVQKQNEWFVLLGWIPTHRRRSSAAHHMTHLKCLP